MTERPAGAPEAPRGILLVVDDDALTREQIAWALEAEHCVVQAADASQAVEELERSEPEVVLLDLHLPPAVATPAEGLRLLEAIRARAPRTAVVVMTGDREHRTALACVARGAADYLEKPVPPDVLRLVVARAQRMQRLEREVERLRAELARPDPRTHMVGTSPAMQALAQLVERVADTQATVLVRGESGTGKELVARALHAGSGRRHRRFVALHCAALPEALVDDELFGHERGAFTGAHMRRIGRFEHADGGTLFLDEVGDLAPAVQVKLLRVVQEGEFERLGGTDTVHVDVRLVAATHRDLEALVGAGKFREDLYYRLQVLPIVLPPLRDRLEDVPALVQHFLGKHSDGRVRRASEAVLARLQRHAWPGNVRELEHAIEAALALCPDDTLQPEHLPPALAQARGETPARFVLPEAGVVLRDVERDLVRQALERTGWNQTHAARLLGVSRQVLIQRMHRYELRPPRA